MEYQEKYHKILNIAKYSYKDDGYPIYQFYSIKSMLSQKYTLGL